MEQKNAASADEQKFVNSRSVAAGKNSVFNSEQQQALPVSGNR